MLSLLSWSRAPLPPPSREKAYKMLKFIQNFFLSSPSPLCVNFPILVSIPFLWFRISIYRLIFIIISSRCSFPSLFYPEVAVLWLWWLPFGSKSFFFGIVFHSIQIFSLLFHPSWIRIKAKENKENKLFPLFLCLGNECLSL